MTLQQLLNHTAVAGYASVTVREAVAEHARAGDGCLTRLRMGVFRLRQEGDARGVVTRLASSWVLEALTTLSGSVGRPVTRREVERQLVALGPRYSTRAVCKALADLRLDPRSGVIADIRGRYRVRD